MAFAHNFHNRYNAVADPLFRDPGFDLGVGAVSRVGMAIRVLSVCELFPCFVGVSIGLQLNALWLLIPWSNSDFVPTS